MLPDGRTAISFSRADAAAPREPVPPRADAAVTREPSPPRADPATPLVEPAPAREPTPEPVFVRVVVLLRVVAELRRELVTAALPLAVFFAGFFVFARFPAGAFFTFLAAAFFAALPPVFFLTGLFFFRGVAI